MNITSLAYLFKCTDTERLEVRKNIADTFSTLKHIVATYGCDKITFTKLINGQWVCRHSSPSLGITFHSDESTYERLYWLHKADYCVVSKTPTKYYVLEDHISTAFNNLEDAQKHFNDLVNFHEAYDAKTYWFNADKVLVKTDEDEFWIALVDELNYV